jgi:hypothetical protein
MEINFKSEVPEDFSTLCDIFQIKPEILIKSILDRISFPFFFCNPHSRQRWSTFLFLEHLDGDDYEFNEKEMELNEAYCEKITNAILRIKKNDDDEITNKKAEEEARKLMREWHKMVMKERSKYLIDNLPNPE